MVVNAEEMTFKARVTEVMKDNSKTLENRLRMFINRYFADRLEKLRTLAAGNLKGRK